MPKYSRVCLNCQKPFISTYLNRCFTCSPGCSSAYNNRKRAGTLEERFWRKVDKTSSPNGCWIWLAHKNRGGYGTFQVEKRGVLAHRQAFELVIGPIPEGKYLLHNCPGGDNPSCVNPYHVFLGTYKDNAVDMVLKDRHWKNPRHNTLTPEQIPLIRMYREMGLIYDDIATLFGVSDRTIGKVIRGERWGYIK